MQRGGIELAAGKGVVGSKPVGIEAVQDGVGVGGQLVGVDDHLVVLRHVAEKILRAGGA